MACGSKRPPYGAIEHDEIRPDLLSIHCLFSGFLAFEGFVNLVGDEIAPDVWKNEREFFGESPFRGIEGKVAYLFTRFAGAQLKKGEEPYQTFRKMKRVRDGLAHSRVFRYEEITPNENPDFATTWDAFDSPIKVEAALEQLKRLAEMIRVEALKVLKEEYQLSHLHYPAFCGPLGDSNGKREVNQSATANALDLT